MNPSDQPQPVPPETPAAPAPVPEKTQPDPQAAPAKPEAAPAAPPRPTGRPPVRRDSFPRRREMARPVPSLEQEQRPEGPKLKDLDAAIEQEMEAALGGMSDKDLY